MKYLSVCSGIEAATVAWHPLGWEPVGFSEIEKFPSAVLKHHYPDTPNYGDMTQHEQWPETDIDVLVGGTPCQSFSVAGLRKGMADPRGNLSLVYLAIADQYKPRWLVWENVPGVLSSGEGRDFGSIIGGMVELGYSPCWRVLDAYHFGTPLRRRRVYVVAVRGAWRSSASVLFDRATTDELRKTSAGIPAIDASGLAKKQTMPEKSRCWTIHDGNGHRFLTPEEIELLMGFPYGYTEISKPKNTIRTNSRAVRQNAEKNRRSVRPVRMPDGEASSRPRPCNGPGAGNNLPSLQHQTAGYRRYGLGNAGMGIPGERPLTPDGPRYKALGNSMAVPVMHWIGKRIAQVSE